MKKIFIPFLLIVATVAISCINSSNKYEELAKAKWLIGKWGQTSPQGTMLEKWEIKDDSTFVGATHFIVANDTVFSETISLEQRGKEVNYITNVSNQNEGKAIAFKMTKADKKKLVFENPQHDFPQMITYEMKGDSLLAEISGKQDGKARRESFPMGSMK